MLGRLLCCSLSEGSARAVVASHKSLMGDRASPFVPLNPSHVQHRQSVLLPDVKEMTWH